MSRLFRWLRSNAERHLLLASQEDMARRYLQRAGPVGHQALFWRRLFVPVYRVLPWGLRRRIMSAMPGSHRQWSRSRAVQRKA